MVLVEYNAFHEQMEEFLGAMTEEETLLFLHAHEYDELLTLYSVQNNSELCQRLLAGNYNRRWGTSNLCILFIEIKRSRRLKKKKQDV